MKYSRLWLAASIIALVVFGAFVLSVPHTQDVDEAPQGSKAVVVPSVTLRDVFRKGVHTITGSLEAPDACTISTAEAAYELDASGAERILVSVSLPEDSGVCLELPVRTSFTATVEAPAGVPIEATVNGAAATTTVL